MSTVCPGRRRPWSEGSQRGGSSRCCCCCRCWRLEVHFAPSGLTSRRLLFFCPPLSGCQAEWRLLLCAVVFSFIQPSKRTPFRGGLEDGRRRRRRSSIRSSIVTPIGMEVQDVSGEEEATTAPIDVFFALEESRHWVLALASSLGILPLLKSFKGLHLVSFQTQHRFTTLSWYARWNIS